MNGTTMGLNSSLHLCAFKMPLIKCMCLMSLTYVCSYQNSTAIMSHSIHNVDISKPFIHMMSHTLSAVWPEQWKPGFIGEEHTSPMCQTPSNVSSQLWRRTAVRSRPQRGWQTCKWASLRRFLNVFVEILWLCKLIVSAVVQLPLKVSMLDVEVLGWCNYMWSDIMMPAECTANFSVIPVEVAYGRWMNIWFTSNRSGRGPWSQYANCMLSQNLQHLCNCAVW